MSIESMLVYGVSVVTVLGVLSFVTACIVEMTKELIPKSIPTKLYCLVVSQVVSIAGLISYFTYAGLHIKFYVIVGCLVTGFLVSYISTYGWEQFKELKDRFIPTDKDHKDQM